MGGARVLMVGLGDLGGHVLELLARSDQIDSVVAVDKDEGRGISKVNVAELGAAHQGFYPDLAFRKIDLYDPAETEALIGDTKPDLIFQSATLQSWWVIGQLPPQIYHELLTAGLGPWIPMHFVLADRLMRAHAAIKSSAPVVNASFPDLTNPILHKLGRGPLVGIGNAALLVPRLQRVIARKRNVLRASVEISLVAHHIHDVLVEEFNTVRDVPYLLRVSVDGEDITDKLELPRLFEEPVPVPEGTGSHPQVAASAAEIILGILEGKGHRTHAPGPNGLPGSYPVRLYRDHVELALPPDVSQEEAVRINEAAQRADGIEQIEADGSVVFTTKAVETLRRLLGYDCPRLSPTEQQPRAQELRERYAAFAARHGVR